MKMTRIRNVAKVFLMSVLSAALFVVLAVPVSAATSGIAIRIKVGSAQMKINSEVVKIQSPYLTAGNVMVPLSVFTNPKGFGAKVQLTNNKIIKLTYRKHIAVMTVGQKTATFDGKKATLPAAPVQKSGVMTVPLASVVKAFGATISKDAKTNEYIIAGIVAGTASAGNSGIDSDSGKSMIGDSFHKWSMNYPTGLVQNGDASSDGSWVSFGDVKGDYYLAIAIEEMDEPMDSDEIRDYLTENYLDEETVVDVRTISKSGAKFERIVAKGSAYYTEYRGFQANGNFYVVMFSKKAKSAAELSTHAGLLDSFKPEFNANNKALKDLAKVVDGMVAYSNPEYGVSLKLPVGWNKRSYMAYPYYVGPSSERLSMEVSSFEPGDTLDQWVDRRLRLYADVNNADYHKQPVKTSITWNGIPATVLELSHTDNKKDWTSEYELYAFYGTHKYYVKLSYLEKNKEKIKPVYEQAVQGMKVDFAKIEKDFGSVPDANDVDLRTVVTKTSKEYGYSIAIPKYWTRGVTMEDDMVGFEGIGVEVEVAVEEDATAEELIATFEKIVATDTLEGVSFTKSKATFAGVDAYKLEITQVGGSDVDSRMTMYLMDKNGKVYMVQGSIEDKHATELNKKQVEDALASFTFTQ
ncbi:copper amine oxidase N-terminal domain-containing protein [Cohnella suwonensis]|uniref:Copper amine oxidase N-terminal domain-containing protein n=1 Tax=Cohnella suwonensis TaxID=696072 RepID=A0ABW0LWZ4_9BACL